MTDDVRPSLALFFCEQCIDQHGRNPQSVSCYCSCHDSRRDEARWPSVRERVLALLRPDTPEKEKPRCIIGKYCRLHQFIHGAEAEELRERFEGLIDTKADDPIDKSVVRYILDDVDARDSAAFVSTPDGIASKSATDTPETPEHHESRSPDGDGQRTVNALDDDRAVGPTRADGRTEHEQPQGQSLGVVTALQGDGRLHGHAAKEPAAGSEPADSRSLSPEGTQGTAQPETFRFACGASATGVNIPCVCPVHGKTCDAVCEHGTALDVHCCNCHSGFIFDKDHECPATVLSLHRCKICGTRWLLWPDSVHGGGWNLLDKYSKPGGCCDNVAMGDQIEHLRDLPLMAALSAGGDERKETK